MHIPRSTGAAKAIGLVIPDLQGKLDGLAVRVPTPNVSLVDVTYQLRKETTIEEVHTLLQSACQKELRGVMDATTKPLVSSDFNGNSHSSVLDLSMTKLIGGRTLKLLSWYDNEIGFSHRMLDVASLMIKK